MAPPQNIKGCRLNGSKGAAAKYQIINEKHKYDVIFHQIVNN